MNTEQIETPNGIQLLPVKNTYKKYRKLKPLFAILLLLFLHSAIFAQDGDFFMKQGVEYYNQGDYPKAIESFLEAKEIYKKTLGKDHPDYAASLNNLAALYKSMGNYSAAEPLYLESKAIREQVLGKDHPDYAASLNNLAGLYESMGDYSAAEPLYLESKAIYERVSGKDHPDYATSLNNLAGLYKSMGNYSVAEPLYLETKAIDERVLGKDHPYYAVSLNNLAALYKSMGNYSVAEPLYLESKAIRERILGKDHPYYAASLNNLATLYESMGNYSAAEPLYLEAKTICERILGKDHPDYVVYLDNLYTLYLSTKKYSLALEVKNEAYRLNSGIVNLTFSFMSEQQRSAYWNEHSSSFEASYSLSGFHPVPKSNILNYDNALFSKGLLLRTANAVRDAVYSSGNKNLIRDYNNLGKLRSQISALKQRGGNEAYILELEREADALDKSITKSSSSFEKFKKDLALNWKDVRDNLKKGEAAIEFLSFKLYDKKWTDKTLYAALVLRPGMDAPVWVQLCEEQVLKEFFAQAGGAETSQEQGRGMIPFTGAQESNPEQWDIYDNTKLYKTIWQPLEKILEGVTAVYYSPSGLLHKITFNAILVEGKTRLMDKYDMHLVSTTREVLYRQSKAVKAPQTATVYGGIFYDADENSMKKAARGYKAPQTRSGATLPVSGIQWMFLEATVSESREVQRLLTKNKTTSVLFSEYQANEESFKNLSGKKTGIIHMATHGFFIEDIEKNRERLERLGGRQSALGNPLLRSGLILAGANNAEAGKPVEGVEDGILFADEVASLNLLGAELVVMSACETGLGTLNNSEGVFGLQRAFKLAGANTLIMSLWEVSDDATSILMQEFYKNWLSGKSKHEAFKKAQLNLRHSEKYKSPYFWAAFVMID